MCSFLLLTANNLLLYNGVERSENYCFSLLLTYCFVIFYYTDLVVAVLKVKVVLVLIGEVRKAAGNDAVSCLRVVQCRVLKS